MIHQQDIVLQKTLAVNKAIAGERLVQFHTLQGKIDVIEMLIHALVYVCWRLVLGARFKGQLCLM